MSLPDSSSDRPRGVLVRRPQTTIYTVLLLIALLALAFSCLLMVLELLAVRLSVSSRRRTCASAAAAVDVRRDFRSGIRIMAQADLITPPTLRVVAPKPKMTIYYALLIISLVAMLTACLFLYLEIRRFGGFGTVPASIAVVATCDASRSRGTDAHRVHM